MNREMKKSDYIILKKMLEKLRRDHKINCKLNTIHIPFILEVIRKEGKL